MTVDNTDVADDLETLFEAFRLLNSDDYERALPLIADDFVMVTAANLASEPDTYNGPDGVRRWWESFLESMEWVRLKAHSFDQVNSEQVVVSFEIHARGRSSGIETSQRAYALTNVRDSKLTRMEFFTSPEEAREAAEPPSS